MTPAALVEHSYLDVARRRWPILLVAAVIGVLGGGVATSASTSGYTSEAVVVVRPIVADPFAPNVRPADSVDLATERQIARSRAVAARAAAALGLEDIDDVHDVSDVEQAGEGLALRFRVTDDDAELARAKANALAEAYLQQRRDAAEALVSEVVAELDAQIAQIGPVGPAEDPAASVRANQIGQLQIQKATLQAVPTAAGTLIDPAEAPEGTSGLPGWISRLGALALALLAGAALAVVVDRRDRRVRNELDLAAVAGPVLAEVHGRQPLDRDVARLLRLRLDRAVPGTLRNVVLTSPHAGPTVGDVALGLASELAADGGAVLVQVDQQGAGPNLIDAAAGRISLEEVLRVGPVPGLRITEIDFHGDDPFLAIDDVLEKLSGRTGHVVCVAPPVLDSAASLELAVAGDAVVLVTDAGTTIDDVEATVAALDGVKAIYAGTVLVDHHR